jgi:hypothetical protein
MTIEVGALPDAAPTAIEDRPSRTIVASPNHHFLESTNRLGEFGVLPSLFCLFTRQVWCTGAPGPPNSSKPPPEPPSVGAAPLPAAASRHAPLILKLMARIGRLDTPFV